MKNHKIYFCGSESVNGKLVNGRSVTKIKHVQRREVVGVGGRRKFW